MRDSERDACLQLLNSAMVRIKAVRSVVADSAASDSETQSVNGHLNGAEVELGEAINRLKAGG